MKTVKAHLKQGHEDTADFMTKCSKAHEMIAGAHRDLAKATDDDDQANAHQAAADGHDQLAKACLECGERNTAAAKSLVGDGDGDQKSAGAADLTKALTDTAFTETIARVVGEQVKLALGKTIVPDNVRGIIPTDNTFGITAVTRTGQPSLVNDAGVPTMFKHLVAVEEA